MAAKRGSAHPKAKLTEADVREIKSLLRGGAVGQTEIARRFGVSRVCIRDIRIGWTWKHVEMDET